MSGEGHDQLMANVLAFLPELRANRDRLHEQHQVAATQLAALDQIIEGLSAYQTTTGAEMASTGEWKQ